MNDSQLDPEIEEFAQQIADAVESFLVALQAMSREENAGTVVPLLLVEVSQILFAGARLSTRRGLHAVRRVPARRGTRP